MMRAACASFSEACSSPSALMIFARRRSEEHTSELQSQSNLVCRLLLEKKKTRAGLVPYGKEVFLCDLWFAREESEFLQAGNLFVDDRLQELPDLLGDVRRLHGNPLELQVVLVGHDVRVVLRPNFDRGDTEVPAHLEDLFCGRPGGRGHPEDQPTGD